MSPPERTIIERCAIAAVDGDGTEHDEGHILIVDGRIAAVGSGSAPAERTERTAVINCEGCLATPGLVNCHHHLYQWMTRGLAPNANLFRWLETLYPIWAHLDADMELAAARAGLAALARSGCTTSTDHHYIWPHAGDFLEASVEAARTIGLRFHPCRGSMDLGASRGGLPPDEVVEDLDEILTATESALDRFHEPGPAGMVRIAVAPCSPFSATQALMIESAELARARGVRLHTHLAETLEEEQFCLERFGIRPVEYLDKLDWLGDDVWLAHCVHLDDAEVARFGATGTGVAHCPSSNARLGAGIAPVALLLEAQVPVGLGVDGAASNEAGELNTEVRNALLAARMRGGPDALSARAALAMGTREGARCLGRLDEIGSLEVGKLADIALWRMDDLSHAGVEDPVTAFVFGPPRPVYSLIVGGRPVISDGRLLTADVDTLARDAAKESSRLREAAQR